MAVIDLVVQGRSLWRGWNITLDDDDDFRNGTDIRLSRSSERDWGDMSLDISNKVTRKDELTFTDHDV